MKSGVWGNSDYPVSQGFGIVPDDSSLQSSYQYASDYGWPSGTHIGLDVALEPNTPIYAAQNGKVIQSGFADYFRPSPVYIEEDDGDILIYGHMWENSVTTGQSVKEGDYLGKSGYGETYPGTWDAEPAPNGPHMHFELRRPSDQTSSGYVAVDPTPELTGATESSGNQSSGGLSNVGDYLASDSPWFERILLGAVGIVVIVVAVWTLLPDNVKTAAKMAAI